MNTDLYRLERAYSYIAASHKSTSIIEITLIFGSEICNKHTWGYDFTGLRLFILKFDTKSPVFEAFLPSLRIKRPILSTSKRLSHVETVQVIYLLAFYFICC